ncbi:hypothetical protein KIN20_023860 [Parelaphostrongylus tenuis]|uniref:Peptidase M12B domain-containing protein n=1 Tax=Parelaphostrongylus tenuis TaxID=148309 RepID=A0AAD5NCG7_PARTN|nr:hypothetical protein KIN20_023860 [Parelaphostrongylus tenuis]
MGMVHDGVQNQCSKSCCLMSAVNGAGKTTWSECSVREFNSFLLQLDETGRGNCLRDGSPGLPDHNHLRDGRFPGQRFTADQQCAYFWGRDYQVEIPSGRSIEDICRILWCGNGGSTISTAHPALEGSYCGHGKWCHEGKCQPWMSAGPPPAVVHGGWSRWSHAGDRCPVQHCQITGSIAIKPQHRDCVNPAPNNGGLRCQGASIRGILCSTHNPCQDGYSREEYSNRMCSSIKHDPIKPDRQLTGDGFEHSTQPCKIWCHLIDSELIRNKGVFPDGTPCGFDQYCISGACLALGCGNEAVVANESDCPNRNPSDGWRQAWSECSATCGTHGRQVRSRKCISSQESKECSGEIKEQRPCLPRLPECQLLSEWGEWGPCESDCGQGEQKRKRLCLSDDCDEDSEERRFCWTSGKMACWLQWAEWSRCSQTCGGGHRKRERVCPLFGECSGAAFEFEQCNTERCSSETWGDWLPCSVSCGIGFQIRERLCDGILCPTANKQARTCNEQFKPCPESSNDYEWEQWSDWSECSQTCGEGLQYKERSCKRGRCPPLDFIQQRRCVNAPCPAWDEWNEWSECPSCSRLHRRSRTRTCRSNSKQENASCGGPLHMEEPCDQHCSSSGNNSNRPDIELVTAKGRRRVVAHGGRIVPIADDKWGDWTKWTECSHTCGGGTRRRARVCIGNKCPSQPLESVKEICNQQSCPDEQNWSPWSEWSTCSISCGKGGLQSRRRRCQQAFLFQCSGPSVQSRECSANLQCIPHQEKYIITIPTWSAWSSWSACSCLNLMESRRRFCLVTDPLVQGFCTGSVLEQRPCVPTSCSAFPGGWSDWSEWSQCSKDCQGIGHQIRNRMCSEPLPVNRGMYCVGYSFDQRPCTSSTPCGERVDGDWSDWSDWSKCDNSCTNVQRSRTRFCTNPRPSQGGRPCFGSDFEMQPCPIDDKCHSVDGAWGLWNAWSECPERCGFVLQTRYRVCDNPPPSHGGQICRGLAHQTSVCDIEFCDEEVDGEWSAWNEWSPCMGNCGFRIKNKNQESGFIKFNFLGLSLNTLMTADPLYPLRRVGVGSGASSAQ